MIVMIQTNRLLSDSHQLGMITQIQRDRGWLRLRQLTQTQLYPVRVRAMMFQSLGDGLFDQLSRMVLMKLEYLNKLTDPGPIRVPALQFRQKLFVGLRPI